MGHLRGMGVPQRLEITCKRQKVSPRAGGCTLWRAYEVWFTPERRVITDQADEVSRYAGGATPWRGHGGWLSPKGCGMTGGLGEDTSRGAIGGTRWETCHG